MAHRIAVGRHAGICPAADTVLAAVGDYAGMLCRTDAVGEKLVHRQVSGMINLVDAVSCGIKNNLVKSILIK